MKSLAALTLALCFAAPVEAQIGGGLYSGNTVAVGPWQPSPYHPGYLYSVPTYGYYGGGYGGRGFYERETAYEIRQLRYSIEDAAWERRWRRR
jgi:hypothetical protein